MNCSINANTKQTDNMNERMLNIASHFVIEGEIEIIKLNGSIAHISVIVKKDISKVMKHFSGGMT